MNCLILGGNGFIGAALAASLANDGHQITIFDLSDSNKTKNISYIKGDLSNELQLGKALQGMETVFHFISTTVPSTSIINPAYEVESNILSSVRLLELCVKEKVKKFIFLSSGGTVYGDQGNINLKEECTLKPQTPYAISKVCVENFINYYSLKYPINTVIFRLSNPYGCIDKWNNLQGVIPIWINKVITGSEIELWGDGNNIRDYVYIDDVIEAIKLASFTEEKSLLLNIGSGIGYSLNQLIEIISNVAALRPNIKRLPDRGIDIPVVILDNTKLRNSFNWSPKTTIEDGIKKLYKFYKEKNRD